MSLVLISALASQAFAPTAAGCSWNEPGHNPYRGTLSAAVDRYTDIPAPVRDTLKARMAVFRYDEMVAIRRDSITGHSRYAPDIRDMHFGQGQVCGTVSRARWSDDAVERGLVYCEGDHCLVVPTVCRNVSRITRLSNPAVASKAVEPGPAAGGHGTDAPGTPGARALAADAPSGDAGTPAESAAPDGLPSTGLADKGAAGDAPWAEVAGGGAIGGPLGSGPGAWGGGGQPGSAAGNPGDEGSFSDGLRPSGTDPRIPHIGGPIHPGFLPWLPETPSATGPEATPPVTEPLPLPLPLPINPVPPAEGIGVPPTSPIPEPATAVLTLLGLMGLAARLRRRPAP